MKKHLTSFMRKIEGKEKRFQELWDLGYNDRMIAQESGYSPVTVGVWRKMKKLLPNKNHSRRCYARSNRTVILVLRLLRMTPTDTFSSIGRELAVSRELVSQIHKQIRDDKALNGEPY